MVINLRRHRRMRADVRGRTWPVGSYRRDRVGARRYRCFLNGEEVTTRTFYVDSRRGIVRMFKHTPEGRICLEPVTLRPVIEERRGRVQLRRRVPDVH